MNKIAFIALTCFTVFLSVLASGETWYVDGGVAFSGDGTSWETAFMTIQEGIDAASHGDTVIVAEGTYRENIHFNGKNIVLCSTDPTDLSVRMNTVIDGHSAGSVVTFDGTEDETCVLSGFTIENGNASIGGGVNGAGLGGSGTHAKIENNIITSNYAQDWGGGVAFCCGVIQSNTISDNSSWNAGGLYICEGVIQNNVISDNRANNHSGGFEFCGGMIRNNVIVGNSAGTYGGGLTYCNGIIQSNTIVDNSCTGTGGGIYGCWGAIVNCIIWGNTGSSNPQINRSAEPSYCCIQDWAAGGEGNISENPQFVKGAYQLKPDSPCIDAARNDDWMWDAVDLDGNPRVLQGGSSSKVAKVDMGAYEYFDGADRTPPYVWDRDPAPDALQVPVSANITFHVKDQLSGVDETSIVMTVNGSAVTPTITGTPADYMVIYAPPSGFAYAETVTVTVDAADLSSPANVMERVTYSFTTIREPSPARIWYVDASVPLPGDGTTPETTFQTIQEGIDASADGDTVIVAEGVYIENITFDSRNITVRSTDPSDPTVVANTIIDGDQSGPVVTFSGTEDETCLLSGFTIRNGNALWGGGICGGTVLDHTHATIEHNIVTANSADLGGGIAWCGGTIRCNTVSSNSPAVFGGGLWRCDGLIDRNTISHNSALVGGGLLRCDGIVSNNLIVNNSGSAWIGGLGFCGGTIRNNLIAGNSTDNEGGGMAHCNHLVENNTIVGNSAGPSFWGGGVCYCVGTVQNCIIWGNYAGTNPQVYWRTQPTYSCIQDWTGGGEGNITDDAPPFDDSYHLTENSPCIDAGKNEDWMKDAVDLDGNPRVWGGTVDMGAYEYGSWPFGFVEVKAPVGVELTWNSREGDTYIIWSSSDPYARQKGWSQEATIPFQGETTTWTDPDTTSTYKFYKIEIAE